MTDQGVEDTTDLASELAYTAATETESSDAFDTAYADFAVRLLQIL